MQFINTLVSLVSLATSMAPEVPHIVSEVGKFKTSGAKFIADVKKLDAGASIKDIEDIAQQAELDLPLVSSVVDASKHIALPKAA